VRYALSLFGNVTARGRQTHENSFRRFGHSFFLTQLGEPSQAVVAFTAASGDDSDDHMVAGFYVGYAFTDFLNITGCFMTTDSRKCSNAVFPFKVMDIAMTNRRSSETDLYLSRPGGSISTSSIFNFSPYP
jgi:hypothetical protein